MREEFPITRDLVLVGGGHSHAIVLRMLAMDPPPGVRITLISDVTHAPYSGMLPGLIAGYYSYDEAHIDLRRLANFVGAQFVLAKVIGIDLAQRKVRCAERPSIAYDLLSVNIGSTPSVDFIEHPRANVVPVKPVPRFLTALEELLEQARKEPESIRAIAIIGGGAGGVELALALQNRLSEAYRDTSVHTPKISIVHQGEQILHAFDDDVRRILRRKLSEADIELHVAQSVQRIEQNTLYCESGFSLTADYFFPFTSASAPSWLAESGLQTDPRGFIEIDRYLRSVSHPEVFAVGDIASMSESPRPKSGVFAVRQGKPLLDNLRASLAQRPLRAYHPQHKFLKLIGTSDGSALASRGGFSFEGKMMWWLKEYIDRKFMRRFSELPEMEDKESLAASRAEGELAELLQKAKMRCTGCGSKVGASILSRTLARIKAEQNSENGSPAGEHCSLEIGLDEPDDAAVFAVEAGYSLVQSIDYFPSLLSDPYLFGRITVNHCFSDVYAMGAEPASALTLITAPYGAAAKMEESIYQLLSGVVDELEAAGAALLGGHTAEGEVLGCGLVCNGVARAERLLRKGRLEVGDVLVLTKPLGTGALFAADMRLSAKGRWIEAAIESMLKSNKLAGECFLAQGAQSATDITGFGLAGHAIEMAAASNKSVRLYLDQIPIFTGFQECVAKGIVSSLHSQNRELLDRMEVQDGLSQTTRFEALFDPQTSGGLLAAIPKDKFAACVEELKAKGYPETQCIGEVIERASDSSPLLELRSSLGEGS